MLGRAVVFFILAIVAAILGFGGIAGIAATIGKVLLIVFLIAFVIALIAGRRRPVVRPSRGPWDARPGSEGLVSPRGRCPRTPRS